MVLQRMLKVQVIGPKKDLHQVVDTLYRIGTIHLEDVTKEIPPGSTMLRKMEADRALDLSSIQAKIGGMLLLFPEVKEKEKKWVDYIKETEKKSQQELVSTAKNIIGELEPVVRTVAEEKSNLEFTLSNLYRYEKIIHRIKPIEDQLPVLEGFEITVILINREFVDVLDIVRNALFDITRNQFELVSAEMDEKTIAAVLVYHRRYSEEVGSFLFTQNVNEVRLPSEYMGKPFDEVLSMIEERKQDVKKQFQISDHQLMELSTRWYKELYALQQVLQDRLNEMGVFSKFAQTDYTFVIMGWIPKKYLDRTRKALASTFGNRVILQEVALAPEEMEEAPTFYDNPEIVKPFEYILRLISPPKYQEIDPSPLITIFFPIFFGLMVGDIAYGFIILAFALIMKKRYPKEFWLQHLMNILVISAVPSIFFGFLFGEFFGDYGEHMGWLHPVEFMGVTWNRVDAIVPLLILSVAIGVFHVFLGLSLGIVNAVARMRCKVHVRECKKHICEKAGMIMVITGLFLVLGSSAGVAPRILLEPGVAVMLIAIPFLIYGRGFFGVFEIISTVGNILSYARIMAIGMASVILALVANKLGGMMEVALVGLLIAALLHILNIVLAMFSPFLHSLRLHLVEFHSKFYEGGGTMYKPFQKEGETKP